MDPSADVLAQTVMKLADAFGVYSTIYLRNSNMKSFTWCNGAFIRRNTSQERQIFITVRTADGLVGFATTEEWNESSVVRSFHFARQLMNYNLPFLLQCSRLAELEQKSPPLLPAVDILKQPESVFLQQVEHHHVRTRKILSAPRVSSQLRLGLEHLYTARSDGQSYDTVVHRVQYQLSLQSNHAEEPEKQVNAGISSTEGTLFAEHLIRQIDNQLSALTTSIATSDHYACQVEQLLLDQPLLLDADITARLIHAWLLSATTLCQLPKTSACLSVAPIEGAAGYYPLHPYGYLLAPAPLLSPDDFDKPYVDALCQAPQPFSAHLILQLPKIGIHTESRLTMKQVVRQLTEDGIVKHELYVLSGVKQFHFFEQTRFCALLPKEVWHFTGGQAIKCNPTWIYAPLHRLYASLVGEIGPSSEVLLPDQWSLSTSQYCLFLPYGNRGEN